MKKILTYLVLALFTLSIILLPTTGLQAEEAKGAETKETEVEESEAAEESDETVEEKAEEKTEEIEEESEATEEPGLKITFLVDNNTVVGKMYRGESGLSMYLEDGDKKILYDAGYSDAFLFNAQRMGIDLTEIDAIVLSHGHFDHTNGLIALMDYFNVRGVDHKIDLICHDDVFNAKEVKGRNFGNIVKEESLELYFNIIKTKEVYPITENLYFLGEIERQFDFEEYVPNGTVYKDGEWVEDMMLDDTAIAYAGKDGVAVIAGCSHSGICNITEASKKATGMDKVTHLIGGLHFLKPSEEKLNGTMEYFKSLDLETIHPCHCVDMHSRFLINQEIPVEQIAVGTVIEIP